MSALLQYCLGWIDTNTSMANGGQGAPARFRRIAVKSVLPVLIVALVVAPPGTARADEDGVTYGGAGTANNSTATGAASIAASSSGDAAANASGGSSIALGVNAQATQLDTIAIGRNTAASGIGAIAIASGNGTSASGNDSIAIAAGAQATGARAIAIGSQSAGGAASAVAVGASANVQAVNGTAFGANAVVQAGATNAVAIGQGSIASAANTVSFGSAGNERRLTNVSAGVAPTDAVNMSQLAGITSSITDSFDSRFGALQSQVNGLQSQITQNLTEARRGIAATAALATAMTPSAPGKTTVTVNTAFYQGETGLGVALAHRLRLDLAQSVIVHGSYANAGGNGHIGRVGLGFEF